MSVHLTLEILRTDNTLLVTVSERGGPAEASISPLETVQVDWEEVSNLSEEIRRHLTAQRQARGVHLRLERSGQFLFDLLLGPQSKKVLRSSSAPWLTLRLHATVLNLPWELLHDGTDFLCRRFAVGRVVRAEGQDAEPAAPLPTGPVRQLIVADPRGDLPFAEVEGQELLQLAMDHPEGVQVDLLPAPTRRRQVMEAMRRYHAVHLAGHGEGGMWRLSDGDLTGSDVDRLRGSPSFPSLVFANACASGSSRWEPGAGTLPRAFLQAGTRHFLGATCDLPDQTGTLLARHFYQCLWSGVEVGEALRLSRVALASESGVPPLAWAGYVLYGDPSQVYVHLGSRTPAEDVVHSQSAPPISPRPLPTPSLTTFQRLRQFYPRTLLGLMVGLILGGLSTFELLVVVPVLNSVWFGVVHRLHGTSDFTTPMVLLGLGRRVTSPRPLYRELLETLVHLEGPPPDVVAFDTWFRDLKPGEAPTSDDVAMMDTFAAAMEKFPVVIALQWDQAQGQVLPPPPWLSEGIYQALVRRQHLRCGDNQGCLESPLMFQRNLRWGSVAIYRWGADLFGDLDLRVPYLRMADPTPELQVPWSHHVAFPLTRQDLLWQPGSWSAGVVGESVRVPLDAWGRMRLRFTGKARWNDTTATFSAWDLETVLSGWRSGQMDLSPGDLSGKVVLVGRDQVDAKPKDEDRRHSPIGEISGVQLQANAIEQLRQRKIPGAIPGLELLLGALVGAWASFRMTRRGWQVTFLMVITLLWIGSYGLWSYADLMLSPVAPTLTLGLIGIGLAWWQDSRRKRTSQEDEP